MEVPRLEPAEQASDNEKLKDTLLIEVAEDGMTAKAVWISPGVETRKVQPDGEMEAIWLWGRYRSLGSAP